MLVHFLLLLWAHKEVVLITNKKCPPQAGRAMCILKLEITLIGDGSHLGVAVAGVSGIIGFTSMAAFEIKATNIHPA